MSTFTFPQRSTESEPVVVELEDVPTAADLVALGLAEHAPKGVRVFPEGHALMGEIMRRNAARLQEADEQRPPISARPLVTPAQAAYLWARDSFDTPD